MRKPIVAGVIAAAAFGIAQSAGAGDQAREYVVLYDRSATAAQGRAAIEDAGGRIGSENRAIGLATVRSSEADFAEAAQEQALVGAAPNRPIGQTSPGQQRPRVDVEDLEFDAGRAQGGRAGQPPAAPQADPFYGAQWDMRMIGATPEGSYRRQQGSRAVRVGIIDTGVEGSHPDIAPNFNPDLSRNFTFDIPAAPNGEEVDGPCEEEADKSCADGPDVDDNGHGTPRRRHDRRRPQRRRDVGRGAEGRAREPARRPGLRLLLPAADRRRAHLRRRPGDRRVEHVVLHRPLALQLPRQPGRLASRAGSSAW